uniref:Uncharacterized protein n=1 Tax=Rhodnius prolixus TaxID=13249 RepID=T1IF95_RHOPR
MSTKMKQMYALFQEGMQNDYSVQNTMYEQQTGIVEIAEQFHEANVNDKNDAHLLEFENLSFSLSFGSLPHSKEEREEMAVP